MALSWNEIKDRALLFSKEWANTANEEADAKPFLDALFNVFGITRRKIGTFEYKVKKLSDTDGYIDMLWKGTILIEMKSRGKNLDKAYQQAKEYTYGLPQHELPRYILVSDFEIFRLTDLEEDKTHEFHLSEFVNHVQHFGYLLGYRKKEYKEQDPANIKAAELMGKLHDKLKEIGYTGHPLELYLVRILFILFAEDTTIFEKQLFQDFIERRTNEDGSDLAAKLQELFQVLDTPKENRFKNLDEDLAAFPYVNGKLFEEILPTASFDRTMRQALLNCCYMDWSEISPAIFGSMFQSVMNPKERRNLGAHYTSETNILKLIKPLFLDELWKEFENIKENKNKLFEFHKKLSTLRFLDPACGCGNFLVITYRELRLLELEVLRTLFKGCLVTEISGIVLLDVDQFYGIEYEEFPARIAEVAMWLIDHQMNMKVSAEFGHYFVRLPLKKAATIIHGDALETNWQSLLNPLNTYTIRAEHTDIFLVQEPPIPYGKVNVETKSYAVHTEAPEPVNRKKFDYILGNPPFSGSKIMNDLQRKQVTTIFSGVKNCGILDYVTCWYKKAAQYIQGTETECAFVSTNSICQGEQVPILWQELMNKYNIKINFAHQTFKWSNEARGNAAVYCVIIGFSLKDREIKKIYQYATVTGEPMETSVKRINAYLVDFDKIFISSREKPLCNVPPMNFGNMPLDGGHLLLSDEEKEELIKIEPKSEKYIKPLISAHEFLNGKQRWCIWLADAEPNELRKMPEILKRIEAVKNFRLASIAPSTRNHAATPSLFRDRNNPDTYILIPSTTSENRKYIPIGFFSKNDIANNSCHIIPNGNLYHFGILTSTMHMSWMRYVCGRLELRYRYSKDIVYNNFPWTTPTKKQVQAIEKAAQKVLDVRAQFQGNSLADLYDPLTMPPALVKAHNELDRVVDLAYRAQPFTSETNRMEFLFSLYEKYTADLFTKEKKKRKK